MSLRLARRLAPLTTVIALGSFAPAASAGEPTLLELMQSLSDSLDEVSHATLEVVQAEKAYDDQMAEVQAAARELAFLFADEEPEAPSHSLIDALLDFDDAPVLRLSDLLLPAVHTPVVDVRDCDPNGTSIYDRLSFGTDR